MTLTVEMPDGLEREVDTEVEKGRYQNKSELVRDTIRRLLEKREVVEHCRLSDEAREIIKEARSQDESYTL
jgi:putative addiction module CopG family antidote